ncbi:hypothetical protein [Ornithinibacillus contaminans]|uniref:hypothetical protein n=1 Tax=Ornithinibacillus contaminans TaxID=694055 RepID=UPI0012ED8658|nr:hypothetical protein [Ornithinibacillus contaminans]
MDFIISLLVYIIPIIILYFVISAAVRNGINSSDVAKILREKNEELTKKRK